MPSWKKVVISGSDAALNTLTVSNGITGSLFGTASYSNRALSSSYALTASYSQNLKISGSIDNVDYVNFTTGSDQPQAVGRLGWDDGNGTLSLGLKGSNVNLQVGQEMISRVFNADSIPLTDGMVVYISGSQGNRIAVKRATAISDSLSANTLGMVTEPIAVGAEGYITTQGVVNGLNTLALSQGSMLFLSSSAGQYTSIKPTAPIHTVVVGFVQRSHATIGSIYVKIDNGYELGELHDVVDSSTTSSYGDILTKSGSVWVNSKQLTGSYGITGSLAVTNGITGSLFGTASWAVSSSYALTASNVPSGYVDLVNTQNIGGSKTFTGVLSSTGYVLFAGESPGQSSYGAYASSNNGHMFINSATASFATAGSPGVVLDTLSTSGSIKSFTFPNKSGTFALLSDLTGSLTASLLGTASYALTASYSNNSTSASYALSASWAPGGSGATFPYIGSAQITGSLGITGSLQISNSILQYSNNAAIVSGSTANIASFSTSSYMAGFFDFVAHSGTNARAGTVFTVWNGANIEYVETSTNDIGATSNLILSASLSGANVLLQGRSLSGSWSVKTLTRMI